MLPLLQRHKLLKHWDLFLENLEGFFLLSHEDCIAAWHLEISDADWRFLPNHGCSYMRAGKDCGWWTRSQSIRTEGAKPSVAPKSRSYCCDEERRMEVPFEVALVDSPVVPTCMGIAEKTLHLKELNMNPNRIAVALKVDLTTVTRALRWKIGR